MRRRGLGILAMALLVTVALSATAQEGLEALLGSWKIETAARGRTITSTLTIARTEDGTLTATWKDRRAETAMQEVHFADGKLTFKRTMNTPRGEFTLDYEVWVENGKLHGKIKTRRGSRDFEGERIEG